VTNLEVKIEQLKSKMQWHYGCISGWLIDDRKHLRNQKIIWHQKELMARKLELEMLQQELIVEQVAARLLG
jgi:hypothetical protein